ncbi:MAG: hypothetical protein M3138_08215 [Actinomycetota bacterium]|nr:hypothetical protein [Actinomycetota bacterium]
MRSGEEASRSSGPLRLAPGEGYSPDNLPARLTSFIGRQRELSEIHRLMKSTRLLSLVG